MWGGCQFDPRQLVFPLEMLLRRLIQILHYLLQGIPKITHKRRWIHFLLRPLILLHQQLFRPSPRTRTQVDGAQQQSRTHSIARSVGLVGADGVVLASHIPASIVSTSGGLPEPPAPSDIPYIVGHEDSHQRSPYLSVRDALEPFHQENTRWVGPTHDPVHHESSGTLLQLQPCAPRTGCHPHSSLFPRRPQFKRAHPSRPWRPPFASPT